MDTFNSTNTQWIGFKCLPCSPGSTICAGLASRFGLLCKPLKSLDRACVGCCLDKKYMMYITNTCLDITPLQGSYEIQSYSLGHTKFVTSAVTVPAPAEVHSANGACQPQQQQVLSASGDGTIRLWDVDTGKMLGCFVASEQPPSVAFQQQQQEAGLAPADTEQATAGDGSSDSNSDSDNGNEQPQQQKAAAAEAVAAEGVDGAQQTGDTTQQHAQEQHAAEQQADVGAGKHPATYQKLREACSAVLSVAVSPDGHTVAATVEGQQEVQLLSLNAAAGKMQLLQKLSFADVANPAAVAFDNSGRLWAVGGVLARDTESLHLGVAAESKGALWCR